MKMIFLIPLLLLSCCFNVVLLEALVRADPGCGNLVTCVQFLGISIEGFVFATDFGRKKRAVPIRQYMLLVVMFFTSSVANNISLNYDISMPLHMIFKSGSLLANMIMSMIILKRRYSVSEYIAVVTVTIGIYFATVASQHPSPDEVFTHEAQEAHGNSVAKFLSGLALLVFSLFAAAFLGIFQEFTFKSYGKHPREALYYSHVLPLPGFILLREDIYEHMKIFSASEPWDYVPYVPMLWLILLGNIVTQYICIRCVFTLSSVHTSLTTTMIITLRKFISLVFSIWYFQNPFTTTHWLGTFLVFTGTLMFAQLPQRIRGKMKRSKEKRQ